ncbi:3-dehydroquinate synthase [Cytobacillus sp. FJAT-54145]|uniref:3-dehydroquinate synthase n=1 Tax=Cytobacillus spartinae TaxID=3299023 RepID=A0ABW6KHC3_9BACI
METILIQTPSKKYPVHIGSGVIEGLSSYLIKSFPSITNVMIITDENVADLYLNKLVNTLATIDTVSYVVPSGEKAKTFDVYYQCLTFALQQKLDRKSLVLAFGGGAVGDLAGFVAGTFMRGIPFIQVPTTILAHDSAVGGKVAINHPLGKNMIGVFYQPEAVYYDLNFLKSLPLREKRSGFAEVIKHGLIQDVSFYEWLLEHIHSLDDLTEEQLSYCLARGITIKGAIVSQDEKESGIRAFLNLGHTLGHAIEAEAGYGEISHGEAVIIGMVFALQISSDKLGFTFNHEKLVSWLNQLGYDTEVPSHLSVERLLEKMKQDKKSVGQTVQFVLLKEIGQPVMMGIDDDYIVNKLKGFLKTGEE